MLNTSLGKEEILVLGQGMDSCRMMDRMLPSLGNLAQRKTVFKKKGIFAFLLAEGNAVMKHNSSLLVSEQSIIAVIIFSI